MKKNTKIIVAVVVIVLMVAVGCTALCWNGTCPKHRRRTTRRPNR